jgi:rubrerythrin
MSDKPSYLGLLNAVSLAESAAHEYLTAWAAVTPHEGVKATLLAVAAREGEHGMSFAKRINELGYDLRPGPDDPKRAERLAVACSTEVSDYDKMHALGVARIAEDAARTGPDIFDKFFSDHSIDVQTGELLGRYIAEERDSGRRLRACYLVVKAEHDASRASSKKAKKAKKSKKGDKRMRRLEDKIDALCSAVEQLQRAATPTGKNGQSGAKAAAVSR